MAFVAAICALLLAFVVMPRPACAAYAVLDTGTSMTVDDDDEDDDDEDEDDEDEDDDDTEESVFELSWKSYTFSKKTRYSSYAYLYMSCSSEDCDEYIAKASSSKSSVAMVKVTNAGTSYACAQITPKKPGSTTITVTGSKGTVRTAKVTVKKNWFNVNLKCNTYASIAHRTKKISVHSWPKATVMLKIGGTTYKKKTKKDGYATIKLKTTFSAKTSYKISAKKGKYKCGLKKGTVYNNTWASRGQMWSCQYSVPVTCYNVKKGDKVILRIGTEKYSKKVTSVDYNNKFFWTFYTKYTGRNYYNYRVIIKSSGGKKLYDSGQRRIYWS